MNTLSYFNNSIHLASGWFRISKPIRGWIPLTRETGSGVVHMMKYVLMKFEFAESFWVKFSLSYERKEEAVFFSLHEHHIVTVSTKTAAVTLQPA